MQLFCVFGRCYTPEFDRSRTGARALPKVHNRAHMTTRTGKIARLPRDLREQVNRRLQDGEPAEPLLAWLNAQPQTLELLNRGIEVTL